MPETILVRGRREQPNPGQSISFVNISDGVRLNYAEIALKSKLTEYLRDVSMAVYTKYEVKLDLINIVDNIVKQIKLEHFLNISINTNHIFILSNMIYNEIPDAAWNSNVDALIQKYLNPS